MGLFGKLFESADSAVVYNSGEILAPIKGEYIKLEEIEDEVFSQGILGMGCGIRPVDNIVYAPFPGTISSVADTKHAVGITTVDGGEFLIHVGMDTVEMNGDGFKVHVSAGDRIKAGQKLLEFDLDKIKAASHPTTTAFVLTNSDEFSNLKLDTNGSFEAKVKVGSYGK